MRELLVVLVTTVFLVGTSQATCGRCNNLEVTMFCKDDWYAYPIEATGELGCEVVKGGINMVCVVNGLLYPTEVTSYTFKSGKGEVADFKAVTHSDATNDTLVVDSVTEDIVYYCVATVKDANGDTQLLRSNTVAVKKVVIKENELSATPTSDTKVAMSISKSYVNELKCNGAKEMPTDWYPLPEFGWTKDDKDFVPTHRVFPIDVNVGSYKRGSLIFHGFLNADSGSSSDLGTYKCTIYYMDLEGFCKYAKEQFEEMVKKDPKMAEMSPSHFKKTIPPQDMMQFQKNKTTSELQLQDDSDSVSEPGSSSYAQSVDFQTLGRFIGWGEIIHLEAYAIGGPLYNLTGSGRAVYKWSLKGPEAGLYLLNETCVTEMKAKKDPGKEKRDEGTKEDEIDFYKYPMCVYMGSSTVERTVDLHEQDDRDEMGIIMGGPSNNYITLPFSYGLDQSTVTVTITYAANTDVSIASVTKEVTYQGENIVFGRTPSSMNGTNTCAYSSKPVALPFSEFFYQKFTSAEIVPLSDYILMSSVLYQNTLVSGFASSSETLTLNNGIQSSAANKCQYYQITRRNERLADSLWSYNYQTVLVETLGDQGSNSDYKQSDWEKPTISWINGTVGKTDMTVTCQAVNEDKKGTIAVIDIMCPHMDIVEKVDGVKGTDDCSYNASITVDMTKLSDPCHLTCMAKSQCSYYEVKEHVVMPIKCMLPDVKNGSFFLEDGLEAMHDVLYGTVLKPSCADGFQRQGPDTVTCHADGSFGDAEWECIDLNVVTCTTLDSNFGTMNCDVTKDPVECTYFCPADNFFELDDVMVSKQTVTCDSSTARWSHMSSSNPLGNFPQCSVTDTATYITMTTKLGFSGATTCPSSDANIKSGLQTSFQSSSSSGYACMKSSCSISEASCTVTSSVVYFTFTVNQTSGDLSTDSAITAFQTQLASDVKDKKLAVTVSSGSSRRKRADTSFTSNGEQSSTSYSSACSSGSGSIGSKCLKCPTGTFESDGNCESCAKGSYSNTAGSTSCTKCSGSLTTITTGSDSITDCINQCTVSSVANGFASPSVGYTVAQGTVVSTFCNSNYAITFGDNKSAMCNSTQPSCKQMCTVKKVSGNAVTTLKTGSELSVKQNISYTCKNDDEGKYNVECETDGADLSVTCLSYTGVIVGSVFGVLFIVLAVTVSVRIYQIKTRPQTPPAPPPLPARREKTPPPPPEVTPDLKTRMLAAPGDAIGKVGDQMNQIKLKRMSVINV